MLFSFVWIEFCLLMLLYCLIELLCCILCLFCFDDFGCVVGLLLGVGCVCVWMLWCSGLRSDRLLLLFCWVIEI